ncbi:MAG: ECF transporter S component, partial [Clostridia bacterium]|nr:ECF transporter S component [Clostridia bacterium]
MKQFFIDLTISRFLAKKKFAYMIAYIALLVAISAISNMFLEIKLFDTQFSLTITISAMIGYIAGPITGFAVCMLGDLLGYLVNGGGMYYFWVALSTGAFALIAGLLS